jgi:hypothetical protein
MYQQHYTCTSIVIILVKGRQTKENNIKNVLIDPCSRTIQYSKTLKL